MINLLEKKFLKLKQKTSRIEKIMQYVKINSRHEDMLFKDLFKHKKRGG